MTVAQKIDVRNLESVRAAAKTPEVVLGDDWVAPQPLGDEEFESKRHRGLLALRRSPIARKIITFNLIAMMLLIAGVLFINSSRDTLAYQRAVGLVAETELIADVFEAHMPENAPVNLVSNDGIDVRAALAGLDLTGGIAVGIFDLQGNMIATTEPLGSESRVRGLEQKAGSTYLTDFLNSIGDGATSIFSSSEEIEPKPPLVGDAVKALWLLLRMGPHI